MPIARSFIVIMVGLILTGCSGIATLLNFDDPTAVVRDKYEALSHQDQAAYLNTVVPTSRDQIALASGVAGVLTKAFIALDPLEMNYGGWMEKIAGMDMVYRDMRYEVVGRQEDYALVKAAGTLSMGNVANFRYCMYQDVRKINGQWFNDEFSEKKNARLQPLVERQMQRLQAISQSSGVDPFFGSADIALLLNPQMWDVMFDLC